MPSPRTSRSASRGDDGAGRGAPRAFLLQALGWSHRDAVAFVVGVFATVWILVNVLFMQPGPHPAPMFKTGILSTAPVLASERSVAVMPPPRPAAPASGKAAAPAPAAPPRPAADIISDIQRELARRGFYDGAIDGRYGPKTDAAIRDFEQAARLKPSTEPNEALLRAIKSANPKTMKPGGRAAAPGRSDPIAQLLAPSDRVLAVQRALTEYGYGQIEPTGIVDPQTQVALEKFERARKLPVTGRVSDRLARELAAVTGRPLE